MKYFLGRLAMGVILALGFAFAGLYWNSAIAAGENFLTSLLN